MCPDRRCIRSPVQQPPIMRACGRTSHRKRLPTDSNTFIFRVMVPQTLSCDSRDQQLLLLSNTGPKVETAGVLSAQACPLSPTDNAWAVGNKSNGAQDCRIRYHHRQSEPPAQQDVHVPGITRSPGGRRTGCTPRQHQGRLQLRQQVPAAAAPI